MDRNQSHYDLRDAFAGDGCPVCALGLASVVRYFEGLNYEAAGDRGVRARLRDSLGFCNVHAHQWLRAAHVLATATIYAEILPRTVDELRTQPFQRPSVRARVSSILRSAGPTRRDDLPVRPTAPCPACRVLADSERMLVQTLLQGLAEPDFRDAFAASPGLCLPHLRRVLSSAPDRTAFVALRDTAVTHEERLLEHLRELIRKHDYRFQEGLAGEEKGAGERAIRHVSGDHGIGQGPPGRDES